MPPNSVYLKFLILLFKIIYQYNFTGSQIDHKNLVIIAIYTHTQTNTYTHTHRVRILFDLICLTEISNFIFMKINGRKSDDVYRMER